MTFSGTAQSLIKHGIARQVDAKEGMDLLDKAVEHNLVQFGENVQNNVAFICNCCGCCCEAMLAAKRFAVLNPSPPLTSCRKSPPSPAMAAANARRPVPSRPCACLSRDPHKPKRKKARIDESLCLGCGVCVRTCPNSGISLRARKQRVLTPVTTAHRAVLMAIERGQLQNLIFDNQAQANHRAMAPSSE